MIPGQPRSRRIWGLSPNVFFLGLVSFLTDVSSEMMFTILPLFLFNVLRVGTPLIGVIEGVAESTASLMKIFSGWLSDRLGRRKGLAVLGYALSTAAKPFLYFATAWGPVLAVRFTDRLGKGIRTSPRDALIADSTSSGEMGRSFGFHRAMDTFGAVLGLAAAAGIVFVAQKGGGELARSTYQWLVLIGVVPAVVAVILLLLFVQERKAQQGPVPPTGPEGVKRGFDTRFKLFLAVMVIFTLGNSSDAFLVLRAQNLGFSVVHILALLIAFNLVYALISLPAGLLSDKFGRKGVIVVGWSIYALTYLGFAVAGAWWQVWLLFALYGLYHGISEGVVRAFVADIVPVERRGTAYGLYHGAVGLSALPASVIAGWLWQAVNPGAPFLFGAGLAAIAALCLLTLVR